MDAGSAVAFSVVFAMFGAGVYAVTTLVVSAAFMAAPLLNRLKLHNHARFVVIGVAYLSIFVYAGALGREAHVHMLFLPAAITGLSVFAVRTAAKFAAYVSIPIALFTAIQLGVGDVVPRYPMPVDSVAPLAGVFDTMALVVALVVVGLLNRENARFVDEIAARNDQRVEAGVLAGLQRSAKMAALGQLAGGIAHDFNNMLMAVQNFIGFAQESLPERAEARGDLFHAEQAVARATQLSRQLLQFSRQEPNEVRVFDLNQLVGRVRDMVDRLVGAGIAVVVDLYDALPPIEADASQLEQVLVNLCLNARDAMQSGGTITIRTQERAGRVLLEVEDTGEGMTDEVRQRVFEPFFTTKPAGEGTGLGLATCYAMVSSAKGKIDVRSELGKGTTFAISLPVVAGDAVGVPVHARREPSRPGQGQVVLLAEDDEIVRMSVQRVLERAGYEVRVAARGQDALQMARDARPDALLTDIVMPGMSGPRLADAVRNLYPDVGVLLMTGCAEDEALRRGAQAGKFDVLRKPVPPERLIDSVRSALA